MSTDKDNLSQGSQAQRDQSTQPQSQRDQSKQQQAPRDQSTQPQAQRDQTKAQTQGQQSEKGMPPKAEAQGKK